MPFFDFSELNSLHGIQLTVFRKSIGMSAKQFAFDLVITVTKRIVFGGFDGNQLGVLFNFELIGIQEGGVHHRNQKIGGSHGILGKNIYLETEIIRLDGG